jgi:uncharacterized integral membrane protein (TIGR00698 family)
MNDTRTVSPPISPELRGDKAESVQPARSEHPPRPGPPPAIGEREDAWQRWSATLRRLAPGIGLSAAVAIAAVLTAPLIAKAVPIPAMVIALIIGIALNRIADRPVFQPGIVFCVKTLLRWAVALLGLRIALGEIVALGLTTAAIVVIAMVITVVTGFMLARLFGQTDCYGALAGAGTAVCGASATLATATVLPQYPGKEADVAFVVVAVNALSTVAMVLYPLICIGFGFSPQTTGVMLGATIHDVAQVVGAGYAVSDAVGDNTVIVKLFRVFLLLIVVLAIGAWFTRAGRATGHAKIPVPVFAFVFLALCMFNSAVPAIGIGAIYEPVKIWLLEFSKWGLLIAIGALGLGTSLKAIAALGWRHVATVTGTTIVILVVVTAALAVAG